MSRTQRTRRPYRGIATNPDGDWSVQTGGEIVDVPDVPSEALELLVEHRATGESWGGRSDDAMKYTDIIGYNKTKRWPRERDHVRRFRNVLMPPAVPQTAAGRPSGDRVMTLFVDIQVVSNRFGNEVEETSLDQKVMAKPFWRKERLETDHYVMARRQ